ncbi:Hexaprenyldihydroxybenzoate methyltransferase, mitochondrial [Coemansia sp. RSA 1290]|nr:3-demethylubiquinone-9 3-methyltransferase [Coemansia mojavensis]KAJ1742501.1 Hexaprenyldihydroxybenzoate methyltransferase, mitochondrial [Coemansia sp. RSA 1086]KAJ1749808.1 Hexaprenyldihydroxybenzoate methyltransferase, mitochondrial [Coemansia sp. RSA 1821]KAJ1871887.1 Hexaprenyldihydroxybenzoate methyltransferase, mitochondrial [Coemansia sp. RSA 990]KAJ2633052.1 Hexaprenyldihydroxybenzoate methyltransferase, mitochondrial [Coemansia sp. RSA 1290]KAJ2649584.1 Hexaprenyldihydroxybenzoat
MLRRAVWRLQPTLTRQFAAQPQGTQPLSSISPHELEKFTRISAEWWDPLGPFKYLHTMNRPRVQFIRQLLLDMHKSPLLANLRGIDVGCGGGLATESLARLGINMVGIDAAKENIMMARMHQQQDPMLADKIEYRNETAESRLGGEPGQNEFDVVVSLEVIEHVRDPFLFVKSLVDLARPGGLIVLSTMNKSAVSWIVDIVVPEYIMRSVERGTHDYSKFIPPEELVQMLQACGVQILDTQGLVLNPLTNQCTLVSQDCFGPLLPNAGVQANYILAARKI